MNTTEERPEIKKPTIRLGQIIARSNRLYSGLARFDGCKLEQETFYNFAGAVIKLLPQNASVSAVMASLNGLVHKKLDLPFIFNFSWRMGANVDTLCNGDPVLEWEFQKKYEWVASKVVGVTPAKKGHRVLTRFDFLIISGSPVGLKTSQFWSNKKAHYLAVYRDQHNLGFGFGKSKLNKKGEQKGKLLFSNVKQFYGLQCLLLLDPKKSDENPAACEIGHCSATMAHNRDLITKRDRDQSDCLHLDKLRNNPDCFYCHYGKDRCRLATHDKTYRKVNCSICGSSAFSDPADLQYGGICIKCANKERLS